MKALSVRQPWATLMPEGIKTIELRSWPTDHRGELLICATSTPRDFFWKDPEEGVTRLLHAGCMIGIVEVLDCRPMRKADAWAEGGACCAFDKSAYAWVIAPVCWVRPDAVRGRLGIFDVPDDKVVRLKGDDWMHNYPHPQGPVKQTKRSPILEI